MNWITALAIILPVLIAVCCLIASRETKVSCPTALMVSFMDVNDQAGWGLEE